MSAPTSLYDYEPNKILPIVSSVAYGICMAVTVYRTHKNKCYRYLWPWLAGLHMEVVGYILRIYSVREPKIIWAFATSQSLIVVAPALLAATLYMSFGRLVSYIDGGNASPIQAHRVTKVFVTFDIISFLVQASGGSMYANVASNPDIVKPAKAIVLAGLAIQIVAFSVFIVFSIIYKRRIDSAGLMYDGGNKLLIMLWTVGGLILARSIFRLVEFGEADQVDEEERGFLMTHEVMFYVFECLPMFIALAIFAIFPPSLWLPVDRSESLHGLPTTRTGEKSSNATNKSWWKWNRIRDSSSTSNSIHQLSPTNTNNTKFNQESRSEHV